MKSVAASPGGFTLLETVVSLGLFALCFALTLPFLQLQRELWADQQAFREEHAALSAALGWISRDLQKAGYGCPGPAVVKLEEEHLTYALSRSEDDPAGVSAGDRRLVSVYLRDGDLMYRIQAWDRDSSMWRRGSSQAIARGVARVRFVGRDASGEPAAQPSVISSVEMTLVGGRTGALSALVAIRNRRGSPVL